MLARFPPGYVFPSASSHKTKLNLPSALSSTVGTSVSRSSYSFGGSLLLQAVCSTPGLKQPAGPSSLSSLALHHLDRPSVVATTAFLHNHHHYPVFTRKQAVLKMTSSSSSTTPSSCPPPPPFHLFMPHTSKRLPLLFDSPHSGRYYPPDFRSAAPLPQLRKGEDAYVDLLISPDYQQPESGKVEMLPTDWHRSLLSQPQTAAASESSPSLLLANYPRCYIDLNRAPDDIDPSMLDGDCFPFAICPTDKSKKGLGLLRRLVNPGIEIYQRKLTPEEVMARLTSVYWPYHR